MTVDPVHHRRSIRLPGYDYAQPGAYFVTVVTRLRACLFGAILKGEICLSEAGRVADESWRGIRVHFPRSELGAFVVMPNHIHGIIILQDVAAADPAENGVATISPPVGAQHAAPLPGTSRRSRVAPGSVGTIVRSYKAAVTRQIVQRFGGEPKIWQRNYFEHIIRNERDHQNLQNYILANAQNWENDEENQG